MVLKYKKAAFLNAVKKHFLKTKIFNFLFGENLMLNVLLFLINIYVLK